MQFSKSPISAKAAVQRLVEKGMVIPDRMAAEKFIQFVNYFRLRGFCLPFMQTAPTGFQHGSRVFIPGTTWRQIQDAYECDRALRTAILAQLERIEIAFRSVLVNHMSHKYGTHFYCDLRLGYASKAIEHMDWLIESIKEIKRSGEHSIKQYLKKYTVPPLPPAWYVTEAITFTKWSILYDMLPSDKGAIASHFKVPPDVLESWIHALAVLRNMCSHHSRLFGKNLTLQPSTLKLHKSEFVKPNAVYTQLAVIQILIKAIDGNSDFFNSLALLHKNYINVDFCKHYGFRSDWQLAKIWQ